MNGSDFWRDRLREGGVLNPIDRISEVLFGLIMVLTFTGAISIATDGREEIRELLWAALGCNVAWGIVDAIMYLMNVLLERGHSLVALRRIKQSSSRDDARAVLSDEIQPVVSAMMTDEELDRLCDRLKQLPEPARKHLLTGRDLAAGAQIFLLVFLCTLPVALPFAWFDKIAMAMRVSNAVAIVLLFLGGYILAGYAGFNKGLTAIVYTCIGISLAALTMALGG